MAGYIYGDVLFAVNFLMNALVLWGTCRFTGARTTRCRIAAASAFGAGYSVLSAWLGSTLMESAAAKVLLAVAMVAIAFGYGNGGQLLRLTGYTLSFSFMVAGATMAVWAMSWGPGGWVHPLKWWGLALATPLAVSVARAAGGLLRRRLWPGETCLSIEIGVGEARAGLTAFLDTGNRLEDPVTGEPVVVAEYAAVRGIVPAAVGDAVSTGDFAAMTDDLDPSFAPRIRVLPFSTLGEAGGLMVGFRPDSIVIEKSGRRYPRKGAVVAICRGPLSPEKAYQALLNPGILDGINEPG